MSIPPIDNTQKFLDRQANSSPEKTPVSPDFTDTLDAGGRRIVQEMSKISADPSGIRINISPSQIERKITDNLRDSPLGDFSYNVPSTFIGNLDWLERASSSNNSKSQEKALLGILANLVFLNLRADPSLLKGITATNGECLEEYSLANPVNIAGDSMKFSIERAEAQILFTTDSTGAVTGFSGTYTFPKRSPAKQIPKITLSEPINFKQIGKSTLENHR